MRELEQKYDGMFVKEGRLGVVAPFIVYKMQKHDHNREKKENEPDTKLASTEKEKSVIEVTLSTAPGSLSPFLLPDANIVSPATNKIILDVAKALESQPITYHAAFCGYNAQNIQTITIRYH